MKNLLLNILLANHSIKLALLLIISFLIAERFSGSIGKNRLAHLFRSVLFSVSVTLCVAAWSTALGYIPEDWSALRLAVPLYLLEGFHLYPDFINDPSTCFIYLPAGVWVYLPAAFLGKLMRSSAAYLACGWIETTILFYAPLFILIKRSALSAYNKSFLLIVVSLLAFSAVSLRYIATIVHVDVVGIALAVIPISILIPSQYLKQPSKNQTLFAGVSLALSFFVKQTFVPLDGLILMGLAISCNIRYIRIFYVSGIVTVAIASIVLFGTETFDLFWMYTFKSAAGLISIKSMSCSFGDFIQINYPVLLAAGSCMFIVAVCSSRDPQGLGGNAIWMVLLIAVLSIPIGIYSYTKTGADVNHFAFSIYLFLWLTAYHLIFIFADQSKERMFKFTVPLLIIFLAPHLISYLKSNCGTYLWINNPHKLAEEYCEKNGYDKVYFPWQPLASLLHHHIFHIEQGFYYEDFTHLGTRTYANQTKYLPGSNLKIAIRPFGDPSYLAKRFNLKCSEVGISELPGWKIYEWSVPVEK